MNANEVVKMQTCVRLASRNVVKAKYRHEA
jgi:hypothetical protein